ncbi:hypothetical protein [Tsukamurella soli]|uniref:hypothetical protein n=1 Tax=Tsukamurella soli TaxID=644556 RepID=UPI00361EC7D8
MPALDPLTASRRIPGSATPSRRRVLALAGLAVGAPLLLAACDFTPDRSGDPTATTLTTLADQARGDAATATALIATAPDQAAALKLVADQRTAHAKAITDELSRYLEQPAPTPRPAAPAATPTLAALLDRLNTAAKAAGDAAVAASGYRASLLGAVSAATSTHAQVVLA